MSQNSSNVTNPSAPNSSPSLISPTNNPLLLQGAPIGGTNQASMQQPSFISNINNPLLLRGAPNLGGVNQTQSGEVGGLPYQNLNANNNNNNTINNEVGNVQSQNKSTDTPNVKLYQTSAANPIQISLDLPVGNDSNQNISIDNSNVWDWIHKSGSNLVNKVLEKTKDSVDTVITTFDPQMKNYLKPCKKINLFIGTRDFTKHKIVKDAFQKAFGPINIQNTNMSNIVPPNIAPQIVGFSVAFHTCEQIAEKMKNSVTLTTSNNGEDCINLAFIIEPFIVEITPSNWYHSYCLYLVELGKAGRPLQMYTETVPLPTELVEYMTSQTPSDYPNKWSGLVTTLQQALAKVKDQNHDPAALDWARTIAGISTDDLLTSPLDTMIQMYKAKNGAVTA